MTLTSLKKLQLSETAYQSALSRRQRFTHLIESDPPPLSNLEGLNAYLPEDMWHHPNESSQKSNQNTHNLSGKRDDFFLTSVASTQSEHAQPDNDSVLMTQQSNTSRWDTPLGGTHIDTASDVIGDHPPSESQLESAHAFNSWRDQTSKDQTPRDQPRKQSHTMDSFPDFYASYRVKPLPKSKRPHKLPSQIDAGPQLTLLVPQVKQNRPTEYVGLKRKRLQRGGPGGVLNSIEPAIQSIPSNSSIEEQLAWINRLRVSRSMSQDSINLTKEIDPRSFQELSDTSPRNVEQRAMALISQKNQHESVMNTSTSTARIPRDSDTLRPSLLKERMINL